MDESKYSMDKYTEQVLIEVGTGYKPVICWTPGFPDGKALSGNPDIVASVEDLIRNESNDMEYISVTPVGPHLPATTSNLYTVVWAILSIYGDEENVQFIGDAPTLADMGLDYASIYDKNGNQIIR